MARFKKGDIVKRVGPSANSVQYNEYYIVAGYDASGNGLLLEGKTNKYIPAYFSLVESKEEKPSTFNHIPTHILHRWYKDLRSARIQHFDDEEQLMLACKTLAEIEEELNGRE